MPFRSTSGLLVALAIAAVSSQAQAAPLPAGAKYVSMGSSFASGPGLTTPADTPPNGCGRSADNYAHQLARRRGLALIDVSCGGAQTTNLLGPWGPKPPQLDAVDAETRLVSVTIGGNDLGYMAGLMTASCRNVAASAGAADPAGHCPPAAQPPSDQAFADVEARMGEIAAEVHRRAPAAQLVFVQYFTVLPAHGTCAAVPLTNAEADAARQIARRLSALTARAATAGHADLLDIDKLSAVHNACAREPWVNGYPRPGAPVKGVFYHPNLAGMTAVADALDKLLR
jgi:hypothetical protein